MSVVADRPSGGDSLPDAREPVAIGIGASALFEVDGGGLRSGLPPNIGGNGGKDTDEERIGSGGNEDLGAEARRRKAHTG